MAAKILLVEDDNNLREIYEARLQAEGYAIVTAKDGEEALSVAKAELPDLVVSDVMMPRVSGFEMLDILRNTDALKNTKVIMLTALGQADDKTRASSLGADRYLVKSQVTLEDIVKAAHELLEGTAAAGAPASDAAAPATPPAPAAPPVPAPEPPVAAPVAPAPPMPVAPAPEPVMPPATPAVAPPAAAAPPAEPVSPAFSSLIGATPPAADPVPAAAPDASAPTTSEEQAAVGAQIDTFVNSPNAGASVQDDAVLASAVSDLATSTAQPLSTTPDPAPAPAPEVPAPNAAPGGSVVIANKKVIQPLSSQPKPSIHELLAKETAQSAAQPPAPAPAPGSTPSFDLGSVNMADHPDPTPPAPNTVFGPAPVPAAPQGQPMPAGPSMPPTTPTPPSAAPTDFDPNNISL